MSENQWAHSVCPRIRLTRSRLAFSLRMLLLAALTLYIGVALAMCCWSLSWLWSVLMETDAMGRSIPPKGFTWDRFGSPLLACWAAVILAAGGIPLLVLVVRKRRLPNDHDPKRCP